MLILTERNPDTSLYFLGSEILKILAEQDNALFFSEIYQIASQEHVIGLNRLILALDWLYMIGCIKQSNQGRISLCT